MSKQTDAMKEEQIAIRKLAREVIANVQELLKAADNCLDVANCFPVYLGDIESSVRSLSSLAAQEGVLNKLVNRERMAANYKNSQKTSRGNV